MNGVRKGDMVIRGDKEMKIVATAEGGAMKKNQSKNKSKPKGTFLKCA
jgi:hypothetical protein